jgi:hypothetical protein
LRGPQLKIYNAKCGTVAEELGKGLQNLLHGCESRRCLQIY